MAWTRSGCKTHKYNNPLINSKLCQFNFGIFGQTQQGFFSKIMFFKTEHPREIIACSHVLWSTPQARRWDKDSRIGFEHLLQLGCALDLVICYTAPWDSNVPLAKYTSQAMWCVILSTYFWTRNLSRKNLFCSFLLLYMYMEIQSARLTEATPLLFLWALRSARRALEAVSPQMPEFSPWPVRLGFVVEHTSMRQVFSGSTSIFGDRGKTVVKVLCYKSEGHWFDPSCCQWKFNWRKILPIALWSWVRLSL